MPNLRGGKAFKKGSKGKAKAAAAAIAEGGGGGGGRFEAPDRDQGVDYARVLRTLGNRRLLCFCNDGMERVCKIRGALCRGPRKAIIRVGDIVLVSFRLFDGDGSGSDSEPESTTARVALGTGRGAGAGAEQMAPTAGAATLDSGKKDVADVIHKYDHSSWRFIRREAGVHPHLLVVTMDGGAGAGAGAGGGSGVVFADENEDLGGAIPQRANPDESDSNSDIDMDAI
jgi:initiation factor 1A